jgi:hypothetical protein
MRNVERYPESEPKPVLSTVLTNSILDAEAEG